MLRKKSLWLQGDSDFMDSPDVSHVIAGFAKDIFNFMKKHFILNLSVYQT